MGEKENEERQYGDHQTRRFEQRRTVKVYGRTGLMVDEGRFCGGEGGIHRSCSLEKLHVLKARAKEETRNGRMRRKDEGLRGVSNCFKSDTRLRD